MIDEEAQWYYCLKHHKVEGRVGCRAKDRIGPFATQEEAEHALEKVHERNEAWKENGDDA
ncbi:hypothetical protein [Actinospica robiniae]|uniref:hypothetical protein n=1 Tax=Actinospica robiniae TaxID=304901 RepID=UPI00041617FD|nr:hypothetical protein [Actinospica robiniae]